MRTLEAASSGSGKGADEHVLAHVAVIVAGAAAVNASAAVCEPLDAAQTPFSVPACARDVRALVSCWCAYERRWLQAPRALPNDHDAPRRRTNTIVEALLVDHDFEHSLENFHALVVHGVAAESALTPPRESLEARVSAWPGANARLRSWWRPREDLALASLADLQLVVPGVWLGSAATLQHADVVTRHKIAHVVCCVSATGRGNSSRDRLSSHSVIAQTPISPVRTALAYTLTLSELPRLDFLRCKRQGAAIETWRELETASAFLLGLVRLHDKFAASTLLPLELGLEDAVVSDSGEGPDAALAGVEMGLLLYCDTSESASVAVCAALLMVRFWLPLRLALLLLRTTRGSAASPSLYLQHQLALLEAALRKRRHGQQLPLRRSLA